MIKRINVLTVVILAAVLAIGCGERPQVDFGTEGPLIIGEVNIGYAGEESDKEENRENEEVLPASEEETEEIVLEETYSKGNETVESEEYEEPEQESSRPVTGGGRLVVIDAGHQAKGNSDKEPVGPGASETKAKVTGGATGCITGQKEYELNLAVAFYLRDELISRGYEVIMVRESNDVDISNSERAAVANDAGADAFIRIHANGSDNAEVSGTETLCQTPQNPYNSELYAASRSLSEKVLDGVVEQTGFKKRSVHETDTMSGINWCKVPVTIVEMGFLSNPDEDSLMYTEEYRMKIATGIADGIDAFLSE